MPDVFTKAKRSEVMSLIRGHGNKDTELALIKLFRRHGIAGWRRRRSVFGKPDFVFLKQRVAVFVDGCFWHGCSKHSNLPSNNRAFWKKKLTANKARDRRVNRRLRQDGWRVVRIWEHDLGAHGEACIRRIYIALRTRQNKRTRKTPWVLGLCSMPFGQDSLD
jgi:DNA mismatch endonuclease (patch repair protein)